MSEASVQTDAPLLSLTRPAYERAFGADRQAGARYTRFWREGEPAGAAPGPLRVDVSASDHGPVRKFLLPVPAARAGDARRSAAVGVETLETESVVIPMLRGASLTHTLCVSSQIGCAMGCAFCETAQMGLVRSLSVGEIAQQWWAARHHLGAGCRNVVFMGMGEPLDNAAAVLGAIEVLTDQRGAAVPMSRITISTVGKLDGLRLLRDRVATPGWRQLRLAVSVNAPNDEVRSAVMPVNRGMPLRELIPMLEDWPLPGKSAICCEYVLIPGVNDAPAHAEELAVLLRGVRCCVNVIPYNPIRASPWPAPGEAEVRAFLGRLRAAGQFCKRRVTKGRDAMAACGQLGNERIRRRRYVAPSVSAGRPG